MQSEITWRGSLSKRFDQTERLFYGRSGLLAAVCLHVGDLLTRALDGTRTLLGGHVLPDDGLRLSEQQACEQRLTLTHQWLAVPVLDP